MLIKMLQCMSESYVLTCVSMNQVTMSLSELDEVYGLLSPAATLRVLTGSNIGRWFHRSSTSTKIDHQSW